ncbi:MAG: sulfate ABC transporter ATP-binding protein [Verrucomicrobia bacterium]|nr:sulfate ABC transporter ATP-binding protein [Verrucomicrobiota bacterium]
MSIEAKNISKTFGSFTALNDVSIQFPSGKLVALLGPSGSGKTTLLRIIAGLEVADKGSVYFEGEHATERSAKDRRVGFVFQHYALFRHMSVFENVAFGLNVKPRETRPSKEEIHERVMKLLKLVQLDWLADRRPSQLSGGQRQRVALARALAVEPKVLLLDEPFGALDAKVRKELRRWLRRLHDEIHVTSIFVTHDVDEALEVADEIVVMNAGRIEQIGTPDRVYEHPANSFVYHFLGNVNLFHTRIHDGQAHFANQTFDVQADSGAALVHARPHDIELSREETGGGWMRACIRYVHAIGPLVRIELIQADNQQIIEAELSRERYAEQRFATGEMVSVRPRQVKVFPAGPAAGDYSI